MPSLVRTLSTLVFTLALASPSVAAILTVGPGGSYPSVSAALGTLLGAGGENEIRVAAGVTSGPIAISSSDTIGIVVISGGWNAAFTTRSDDPTLTVLDGGGTDRAMTLDLQAGSIQMSNVTFRHGTSTYAGAGIYAKLRNNSSLFLTNCRIENNDATGADSVDGGGIEVQAMGTSTLSIGDTVVIGNHVHSTGSSASGGGAAFGIANSASAHIHGCRFVDNQVETDNNQATGGGVIVSTFDSATCEFRDNLIAGNTATAHNNEASLGAGAALWTAGTSTLTAPRNVVVGNTADTAIRNVQLSLTATGTSHDTLADSVVAAGGGSGTGGVAAVGRGGSVTIVNTTIAHNSWYGIVSQSNSSPTSFENCIIQGNAVNDMFSDGTVTLDHNLVGTDPLFVDPSHNDFRLLDGSPAIDAGNNADRSGLDTMDLMGLPRTIGSTVDCGANEHRTSSTVVAAVSHAIGFNGTPWRSDIAISNPSSSDAAVNYTYRQGGTPLTISDTLPAGTTEDWTDFLVDRFSKPPSSTETGSLQVTSSNPAILVSSRTYANPEEAVPPAGIGTFGQYLGGLRPEDFVPFMGRAVLPLLRNDADFYTNIGYVNGGPTCDVVVQLYDANGMAIGSSIQRTVNQGEWGQINDAFTVAGAGQHAAAYAFVGPTAPGDTVWFYASVIDRRTKDPTTIPVVQFTYLSHSYRLPAASHLTGFAATPWRTTLGLVNVSTQDEIVSLIFRGASTIATSVNLPAGHTVVWNDVLVDLFGMGQGDADSGSIEIQSDKAVVAAARSYADKGSAGTYGQYLPPDMLDHDGITPETPGTLQHIRANAHFYTNVGLTNLGSTDAQVRVTLKDGNGMTLGSPVTTTVSQGRWTQINDIFSAAGAGSADTATATVEVLTPGGIVSGYASVIDRDSRDPTTVPLTQAFAVWPGLGDPHQPVF